MIKNCVIACSLFVIVRLIAFFAGSETAYLSVSRIKLRQMVQEKRRNARTAKKLRENIDELLTIILIGINFTNTLGAALATSLAVEFLGNSGVGIATVGFTFLSVIFGEIVPKTTAALYTDSVVCRHAVPLLVLEKLFFPVVFVFSAISKGTARLARNFLKNDRALVTEEELKTLIEVGETEGTLESSEKNMLYKIFRINDLSVYNIMKHRSMVVSVSTEATRSEITELFVSSGLSMLPVYEGNKDTVVGVIHYKSVLLTPEKIVEQAAALSMGEAVSYARSVMKGVLFVPETLTALELLGKFKRERTDFAVALNEQGEMTGVVTIDDIMRIVFGRMMDEDSAAVPAEEQIKLVSPNEFIVPGSIKIEDLNGILNLQLESEEFTTLAGWILEKMDCLPSTGEIFYWQNVLFIIEDQANRKIQQVRIKFRGSRALLAQKRAESAGLSKR